MSCFSCCTVLCSLALPFLKLLPSDRPLASHILLISRPSPQPSCSGPAYSAHHLNITIATRILTMENPENEWKQGWKPNTNRPQSYALPALV